MKKGQIVGLALLIGGIVLATLHSMFKSLQEINIGTVSVVVWIAAGAIVIGVIVLLVSIIFEQTSDMKKRKEEIKKEDFEP